MLTAVDVADSGRPAVVATLRAQGPYVGLPRDGDSNALEDERRSGGRPPRCRWGATAGGAHPWAHGPHPSRRDRHVAARCRDAPARPRDVCRRDEGRRAGRGRARARGCDPRWSEGGGGHCGGLRAGAAAAVVHNSPAIANRDHGGGATVAVALTSLPLDRRPAWAVRHGGSVAADRGEYAQLLARKRRRTEASVHVAVLPRPCRTTCAGPGAAGCRGSRAQPRIGLAAPAPAATAAPAATPARLEPPLRRPTHPLR